MPRVAAVSLFVLLSVASALVAVVLPGTLPVSSAAGARTWVVDAVDDASSNRWESVDTGTSVVTVAVGDTVEWQFDRATQGHDLTSLAPSGQWESVWAEPLEEYRDPDGEPVRVTFDRPGTYAYWCSLHGTVMKGTVVVVDPGGNTAPTAAPAVEPTSVAVGEAVHATANATDPDGDVVAVSWDFGEGAAATWTDHATYAWSAPGTYTTRLRVSDGRGGLLEQDFAITVSGEPEPEPPAPESPGPHAGHGSVSDGVQVVGADTPLAALPAVDSTPPRISSVGPRRTVRTARPTIRARVLDRDSAVRRRAIVLRLDGRRVGRVAYDAGRGRVTWRPGRALAPGRHVVRLVARDTAGNRSARTWRFTIRER